MYVRQKSRNSLKDAGKYGTKSGRRDWIGSWQKEENRNTTVSVTVTSK
jgi:hypothetical protein